MEFGSQPQPTQHEAVVKTPELSEVEQSSIGLENSQENEPKAGSSRVLRFNLGNAIRAAALVALSFGAAGAVSAQNQYPSSYDSQGRPIYPTSQQVVPPAMYGQWGQQTGYAQDGARLNVHLTNPTGSQLLKAAVATDLLNAMRHAREQHARQQLEQRRVVVVNQPVPVQVGAEAGRAPVQQERLERRMDLSQAQGLMSEKGIEVDRELNIVRGTSDASPTLSINNAFNVVGSIDPSGKVRLAVSSLENNNQKILKVYILDTKTVEGSKDINGNPLTILSFKELGSRPL